MVNNIIQRNKIKKIMQENVKKYLITFAFCSNLFLNGMDFITRKNKKKENISE